MDLWGSAVASFDAWQAWRGVICLLTAAEAVPRWTPRPWLSPPNDTAMLRALTSAHPIIEARTPAEAAELLAVAAPKLREMHAVGALRTAVGNRRVLQPVLGHLDEQLGRPSSTLRNKAQQISLLHPEARIDWIPTLPPPHRLPAAWRSASTPSPLLQRAVLAGAAARIVGASTWAEAAYHLGFNGERMARWVRYVLPLLGPSAKLQLAD
ncbi:MAG: hypothetical protein WCP28_04910, partial [Actinomycetes bacterium]